MGRERMPQRVRRHLRGIESGESRQLRVEGQEVPVLAGEELRQLRGRERARDEERRRGAEQIGRAHV